MMSSRLTPKSGTVEAFCSTTRSRNLGPNLKDPTEIKQ